MKIKNYTHYVTSDLKSFIVRAIKEIVKAGEDNRTKRLMAKIVYSRNREWGGEGYSGYAYYNGNFMLLRVPRQMTDKGRFAFVVMHEYDHVLGYKHRQMDRNYNTSWVGEYEIRVQQPKAKEKPDVRLVRYERTKKLLEKKESQLKRLQNSIKKYGKRLKYYEKILNDKNCGESV